MKKAISLLLSAALALGMLTSCGQTPSSAPQSGSAAAPGSETATEPVTIKIWHDGDEAIMQTIADTVNSQLSGDNITVTFEKKTGLSDQLELYGSDAANGPDMYFYAHDSLGTFVAMDILAPLSEVAGADVLSDALPMTVEAGQIGGEQYFLPVYFDTLVFLYNKALWQGDIPTTTEDLYAYMQANTDTAAGTYAVVNQHSTAYNVSPFINGFGGYILNEEGQPGLNDPKTIEGVEYNKKFAALQADGDYNTVTTLFNEGKAAAIIGGPWLVSGIRDAGIDFGVASLSDMTLPNGNPLAPYAGVQGVGVLKTGAEAHPEAIGKVLAALASPEVGVALAKSSGCAPANSKAYEDPEVAADELSVAIQKTAETAQPMPNIPEMGVLWGAAESFLVAENKSGEDVATAAETAQQAALQAIADMQ